MNPAQKVSGHKVSKNDNMGQTVSSQKVSAQKFYGHKVSQIDTWPKKFPPKKLIKFYVIKVYIPYIVSHFMIKCAIYDLDHRRFRGILSTFVTGSSKISKQAVLALINALFWGF